MSGSLNLDQKPRDVIKAEYYELMARIMDVWLKIPTDREPNKEEEIELAILESVAMGYIKVMKERGIYFINWLAKNE